MASPVSHRRLVASIVYRTLYLLLYVCLLGLLIATPADAIHRSFQNRQLYNIWILTAAYVLAVVIISFVFFTRLYINKTDLQAIPKGWVPIEKGDLRSAVYKIINLGLGRSASIAFESRPRLKTDNTADDDETVETRVKLGFDGPSGPAEELVVVIPRKKPVWGDIEHYGWSSPNAPDLPNLQYTTVFSELPNLIEGKALTLAPPDPTSDTNPPLLDPDAVALLQRTANMSLRDYIVHLADLGVIEMDSSTIKFLSHYEYARFSTRPISNAQFKELMHLFAEILRAMEPLDPDILDEQDDTSSPSTTGDDDARSRLGTSRSNLTPSDATSISSSARIRRQPSTNTWNVYETAPNSLRSGYTGGGSITRRLSSNSLARSRRHYPMSQPSISSLRSKSSASSGSVIRLATRHDSTDLPYVLSLRDTTASY
ncbi:thermatolerance membrane Dlt1 [Fusarium beomiforme]|uniref:Defect at low temperature protein 1 n=1 Tax=Fusarium beomiforme TaxID=44412 RepID=A0A9P5AFR3_9HYPO|nr:thermatolerance membrane Dlt1 [Fusarium beomiforme]